VAGALHPGGIPLVRGPDHRTGLIGPSDAREGLPGSGRFNQGGGRSGSGGGSPHRVDGLGSGEAFVAGGASSGWRRSSGGRSPHRADGPSGRGGLVPGRFIRAEAIARGQASHRADGPSGRGRLRAGALHPDGGDRVGGGSPHRADGLSTRGKLRAGALHPAEAIVPGVDHCTGYGLGAESLRAGALSCGVIATIL